MFRKINYLIDAKSGNNPEARIWAAVSSVIANVALGSVLILSLAWADSTKQYFDIPEQSLSRALFDFSKMTRLVVLSPGDVTNNKLSTAIRGEYSPEDALRQMLANSAVTFEFKDDKTLVIRSTDEDGDSNDESLYVQSEQNSKSKNSRVTDGSDRELIEEMIVTATKRATSLQDTPISITAIGSEDIERKSLVSMNDYLTFVPGVNMQDMGVGQNQIVMRGLAAGIFEQSTVTTYLGEVPLTNPLVSTGSADMKLVDMERIEVLRGPQGTLFGGGALGGAVRNIPVAPDLAEFGGKLEMGYSHTGESDDDNGSIVGVINMPLVEDKLALRVAAYRYKNAGQIDLVSTPRIESLAAATGLPAQVENDTGASIYKGIRASLLWQANDKLDVTLMVANQKLEADGLSEALFQLGGYRSDSLRTGENTPNEGRGSDFKLANLVANYDLGWGTLTSSTTVYETGWDMIISQSRTTPWAADALIFDNGDSFLQEVRLASQLDGPLQYTVGTYYEDFETARELQIFWTGNTESLFNTFGSTNPDILNSILTDSAEQMAVFGELLYQLTDTVTITAGGRWFDYTRKTDQLQTGLFAGAPIDEEAKVSGTIFKAGIDYSPTDDVLLYASWSQGFRIGDSVPDNPLARAQCDSDNDGLHDEYGLPFFSGARDPDQTDNYEIGGKFSFMDNRLITNAAVFHIDWTNIPFVFYSGTCGWGVSGSAASAQSQGVELETSYYVTDNFKVNLAASYINAEFSENLGINTPITKGTRLPLSAKANGSVGLQYEFAIANHNAYVRSDVSYIGSYITNPGIPLSGDYVKLDMRAGISLDQFDVELYGRNLNGTDTRTNHFSGQRVWRVVPRTIGVNVRYRF